ncbi:glycosyltransferase family 4 protein [Christiangramia sabulilitoris]|uniref:Undecaprenyl/decaprenyl-phosphate alpha-N-acetylglucosaminyl 1-phosphate transferase n=1 Tax=Christiangramia sabulilitoris TaxID=2583991 RepID=A0A550HZV7_9FLAO|nr:MraY family glycosyltransferase [Christiangramia sabulilitoris]TRO64263.1 undecaprenyl/decaprenyl-phosphate alpha-N-acetylglucosaminyl 1-phosphate transferase [Christiangramia sabulilitoris]
MNILDQQVLLELFRGYTLFFTFGTFLLAFSLTWYFIPKVLWVTKEKQLVKEINHRSSHKIEVPAFGGVAFFLVLILIISVLQSLRTSYTGNHLIIGLTFLFMAGLKDDLVISTARLKFVSQLFAAGFIIFSPELLLTDLHGFLGITEIPLWLGYGLKLLIVIALINAYNLIDGIDGLAGIAGIVICSSFAVIFHIISEPYFVLLSVTIVGVLGAFLRYNFSRGHRKIFMGDGGSLTIGFLIAFLSLKLLVRNESSLLLNEGFLPENRVLFVIAILFLPIYDTLRVIVIRLMEKKSPFEADRNHLHHVLLDHKLTHKQASLVLGAINILIIAVFIFLSKIFESVSLTFIMLFLFLLIAVIFEFLKKNRKLRVIVSKRNRHGIKVQLRGLIRNVNLFS